jgi:hypothetical protein
MILTARVQRGPSEAARCASTGIVPATPPFFSILSPWDDGLGPRHHLAVGADLGCGGLTA